MNKYFRADLSDKKPAIITVPQRKRMMCLNESYLDPFEAIKEQYLERMKHTHINRYLSPISDELRSKLAAYAGCGITDQNVLWGNGCDDVLYHIFMSVRKDENSFAVSLAPSYFDYKTFCDMVGLGIKFVDLEEDFSFDTDKYLEAAKHDNCKLAILCNPNNPTGNLFPKEQLRQIVDALPEKLVLIDETYYEFSDVSFLSELADHPNLILTRSFSKAFSGAGLRFGYAISSEANIWELSKVFQTFHTSIFQQSFALTILENVPLFCSHVLNTIKSRDEVYQELGKIDGLVVHPSHTNFLTFTIGERSSELFEYLKDQDIALRSVGAHPRLKNCLRATISSSEDNAALLKTIRGFLNS